MTAYSFMRRLAQNPRSSSEVGRDTRPAAAQAEARRYALIQKLKALGLSRRARSGK